MPDTGIEIINIWKITTITTPPRPKDKNTDYHRLPPTAFMLIMPRLAVSTANTTNTKAIRWTVSGANSGCPWL